MKNEKIRLAELTQSEMREKAGQAPIILLPVGSIEDQGPHVFMGDYLCAEKIAVEMAKHAAALGTYTLVAPPLPFGCNDYFAASVGGISLSADTFRRVLKDTFASLFRHGLTRLVVINGHGGNVTPIHETTRDIYLQRKILIPSMYIWKIAFSLLAGVVGEAEARASAGHGANPLASMAMHLFSDFVRHDLVPPPYEQLSLMNLPMTNLGTLRFEGAEIDVPAEYDAVTPTGVIGGDARLCSPATGAALTRGLVELGGRFIAHYAKSR
jgi:creatinine amidohydrolase